MNVVEHEQHFICECDAYDVDREILYTIANTQYPLFKGGLYSFVAHICHHVARQFLD